MISFSIKNGVKDRRKRKLKKKSRKLLEWDFFEKAFVWLVEKNAGISKKSDDISHLKE